jgi:DNA-binding transcriptional regulator YdaS (Cro superfamily)
MAIKALLEQAIKICGGSQSDLARKCGVSRQRIHMACRDGKVSPMLAKLIDDATAGKVPKEQLCPDIFK